MDINQEYEIKTSEYFAKLGYTVDVTRFSGDWGVDVFIQKDGKKGAVQVKNYGNCRTKISRKDVMELYGAKAYFDCTFAKIVYNGEMSKEAIVVAEKLGIECIKIENPLIIDNQVKGSNIQESFEKCWINYVIPLQNTYISTISGQKYKICEVTSDKLYYENTKGKKNPVRIDFFKWVYYRILNDQMVKGKDIRDEFHIVHSSLIVSVFRKIPYFEVTKGPYIRIRQ